jgi:hypothetical protein
MALGLAACSSQEDAKKRVAEFLIEPNSAEFSEVSQSGNVICGLVKGKVRIDSYEGYRPFWSDPAAGGTGIMSFDTADQFLMLANRICPSKFGELLQAEFAEAKIRSIREEISANAPN